VCLRASRRWWFCICFWALVVLTHACAARRRHRREECQNYRSYYGDAVPIKHLNDRLSLFVQAHTLYGYIRPFGTSVILGGVDHKGPQLFMIEPSGVSYVRCIAQLSRSLSLSLSLSPLAFSHGAGEHQGYYGCAIGKGRELAKTEMEKLNLKDMTAREALKAVAAMYVLVLQPSRWLVRCCDADSRAYAHLQCVQSQRRGQGVRARAELDLA